MLTSYQKIGPFNKLNRRRTKWIPPFNNISKYNNILKPFSYYGWAFNQGGILGIGIDTPYEEYPVNVKPSSKFIYMTSSAFNSYTIDDSGKLYGVGDNSYYQLGDGTNTNTLTYICISNFGSLIGKTVVKVCAGAIGFTLALDSDGGVHGWGENGWGQLGLGNTTNMTIPTAITLLSGKVIKDISTGAYCSIAVDDTGIVYTWGSNALGDLGDGTTNTSNIPIDISGSGALVGQIIVLVACALYTTYAIDNLGKVYSWGFGGYGGLGNGGTTDSLVPICISNSGILLGKVIVEIVCGYSHCVILENNNTVYTFGANYQYQLCDGTTTNSSVPIPVNSFGDINGKTIVAIGSCAENTIFLDITGAVYVCGANYYAQGGNNNVSTAIFIPAIVPDLIGKPMSFISNCNNTYSVFTF